MKKIGILASSVTFIGLGVVLLANNFFEVDLLTSLSVLFAIVLITIGIEFLYYSIKYKDSDSPIRVNGKSILAIILVAILSFSIVGVSEALNLIGNINFDFDNFTIDLNNNPVRSYEVIKSYPRDNINSINLKNPYGNVTLTGEDRDTIEVTMTINEYAEKRINDTLLDDFHNGSNNDYFTITTTNNSLNIKTIRSELNDYLFHGNFNKYRFNIDYKIKCPKDMYVELDNKYGKVIVSNISKDTYVSNGYGEVDVKSINGNVEITNSYDNVNVENIIGDLIVNMMYDSVYVYDVDGSINIDNSYGIVNAESITGNANLKTSYDDLTANYIDGVTIINVEYGAINVKDIDDIHITSKYTDINYYAESVIAKNIDIDDEYGNINIYLPSNQEGSFDIKTSYGDLSNDFNMPIAKDSVVERINSNVGESNNLIRIKNSYGNISILKLNAVVS